MLERIYEHIVEAHFEKYDQMAFLAGPRQVGKTTIAKQYSQKKDYIKYLNWDNIEHRSIILSGYQPIIQDLPVDAILPSKPLVIFDEIHKYKRWKSFLKGFIDEYKGILDVLVTGSSKLNVFRQGGDSLMGRYFLYRIHPLSLGEIHRPTLATTLYSSPYPIDQDKFEALWEFGGFPEPYLKQEKSFYHRWQNLRQQQTFKEDIRNLDQIRELAQLEVLALLLQNQAGQLVNYTQLSKKVQVSMMTIRRWMNLLESVYYCFTIKPWTKNVSRTLLKEPKVYLWDWSIIADQGARLENFVACHLLKAVHHWNDSGFGQYGLYFLRDKEKREVDFLITQNKKPWIMLEVKTSVKEPLSKNLQYFQSQIQVPHVFQLAYDLPFVEKDCFKLTAPKIVSLQTFLSQLV